MLRYDGIEGPGRLAAEGQLLFPFFLLLIYPSGYQDKRT